MSLARTLGGITTGLTARRLCCSMRFFAYASIFCAPIKAIAEVLAGEFNLFTTPLIKPFKTWGLAEVGNPTIRTSASTSVLAM